MEENDQNDPSVIFVLPLSLYQLISPAKLEQEGFAMKYLPCGTVLKAVKATKINK